jgi:DNA-binding response OmpR family regulator
LKYRYISIEKNIERFEAYKALWKEHGIDGIRVDTMMKAIEKAVEIEKTDSRSELFFISIVADDVDFLPELRTLSEQTSAPILVAVSKQHYREEEHHEALANGADFYASFCDKSSNDVRGVIAAINSIKQRSNKPKLSNNVIVHEDILVDIEHHKAFIEDKEVPLSGTELRILHYLMINRGITIRHEQIFRNVYDDCDDVSLDSLYSAIKRLRKKIRDVANRDYIKTIRDVGYRLTAYRQ